MKKLTVGRRVKYNALRGTVLTACLPVWSKTPEYTVVMDNGARVNGTDKQFKPVVQR